MAAGISHDTAVGMCTVMWDLRTYHITIWYALCTTIIKAIYQGIKSKPLNLRSPNATTQSFGFLIIFIGWFHDCLL